MPDKLTKADTVALWHAVDTLATCTRVLREMEGLPLGTLALETQRLAAARRALRKVNAIRKSAANNELEGGC